MEKAGVILPEKFAEVGQTHSLEINPIYAKHQLDGTTCASEVAVRHRTLAPLKHWSYHRNIVSTAKNGDILLGVAFLVGILDMRILSKKEFVNLS